MGEIRSRCRATTKAGSRCKLLAKPSGEYCHIHDVVGSAVPSLLDRQGSSVEAKRELSTGLEIMGEAVVNGLRPAIWWAWAAFAYWTLSWLLETLASIGPPWNREWAVSGFLLLLLLGGSGGFLLGLLRSRDHFSWQAQFLALFSIGIGVAAIFASAQYADYSRNRSHYLVSNLAMAEVGEPNAEARRQELANQVEQFSALAEVAATVVRATESKSQIHYLDPEEDWQNGECRRLRLGMSNEPLCVRRREFVSARTGHLQAYFPVFRYWKGGAAQEYRVDNVLEGRFRCDRFNRLSRVGGLNFLADRWVEAESLKGCMKLARLAFDERLEVSKHLLDSLGPGPKLPFWYFFAESLMALIGTDFQLVKPIGSRAILLGVGLAFFRYLYFAVFVASFLRLGPLRRGSAGERDSAEEKV